MKNIRIYLDNCCFNRPYDNQNLLKIRLETESKLFIQHLVIENKLDLVWSYILDFENEVNPYIIRKNEILLWKKIANYYVEPMSQILGIAENIMKFNIRSKDALHISCAIESNSKLFITTDNLLIRKSKFISELRIINPLQFIELYEENLL